MGIALIVVIRVDGVEKWVVPIGVTMGLPIDGETSNVPNRVEASIGEHTDAS